jgi:hypothetical protein
MGTWINRGLSKEDREAAWYAQHRDETITRVKAWNQANKIKRRANKARRRARDLGQLCTCCTNEQLHEPYFVAALVDGDVDHKTPLKEGGLHCRHNLQPMTKKEHREKTAAEQRLTTPHDSCDSGLAVGVPGPDRSATHTEAGTP